MGAGLASLTVTAFRGTPDGRLWVRLVAVVALGSVLHDRSDAQWLALVLLALGALAGARLPSPTGRVRVAALAVAVLAIRIALFHAMGFTESFSTLDTGAGAVPGAGQAAAEARGHVGLTSEVVVNALLMALKYGLVWIALLAAVVRSLERDGRAHLLPTIAADLSITYAARAAALVAGVWVWWRSSWWASTAYPVFAIALIDVVLLAAGALWVRTPRASRAAEAPADVATVAA